MNYKDKSITPIIIAVLVLFLGLGIYVVVQRRHHPGYTKRTVDKDTGEVVYDEPNKTKETQSNPDNLVILGSSQLIDAGLTQDQYQLVKQALTSFSQKNLQNKYSLLKILTSDFKKEQNNIYAKLRLGESSTLLDLTIQYHDLVFVRVKTSDPKNNPAYTFDSGELKTDQVKKPEIKYDTD